MFDFKFHSVRVKGQENVGAPNDVGAMFAQHLFNGHVGQVTFARCGQTAVEGHAKTDGFGVTELILFGGCAWTHRV